MGGGIFIGKMNHSRRWLVEFKITMVLQFQSEFSKHSSEIADISSTALQASNIPLLSWGVSSVCRAAVISPADIPHEQMYKLYSQYIYSIIILSIAQRNGDLRLSRGSISSTNFSSGRLEIYIDGEWRTVCYNLFSSQEGAVACRQLGYSDVITVTIAE